MRIAVPMAVAVAVCFLGLCMTSVSQSEPAKVEVKAKAPATQPVAAPSEVPAPTTDAEAAETAKGLWQSLRNHQWWFALAGGIYLLLFLLGKFKLFEKIGTFWAWVLVAALSVAAGIFAAFGKHGFAWKTFFEYATAGPTIAYLRDFGKDVLIAKFKEMREKKTAGPVITTVLLCFMLGAAGCGATEKALIKIQTGTTALRQEGTTYFDNMCMGVAVACPKGKAEDCAAWVKCKDIRRTFYAGTNGIQLMVAAGLNLVGIDKEEDAKTILLQVTAAVLDLHQKLKAMQVYDAAIGATKLFSATPPAEPAPAKILPGMFPTSAPTSAPTGGK